MHSNRVTLPALLLWTGLCLAQDAPLGHSSIAVSFPPDSPVTLVSSDVGESRASARGSAMELDLRMALKLKNSSSHRIRGITLVVSAQEVTPGGKGSFARPSLDVAAGEVFPLDINIRLLRPLQIKGGPLVQVRLDGILFNDYSFYGPNLLDSRPSLMVWETEAE